MQRVVSCIRLALPKATHTIVWLLKLMLPVALFVSFLQYWGVMDWLAQYLSPVFIHIGLPGASAIVFITSLFLPLYSVLAVIATMTLGMREITILAIMCLISHSLIDPPVMVFVIGGKLPIPVARGRSEKLRAIVYGPVAVLVEGQETVLASKEGHVLFGSVHVDVELHLLS